MMLSNSVSCPPTEVIDRFISSDGGQFRSGAPELTKPGWFFFDIHLEVRLKIIYSINKYRIIAEKMTFCGQVDQQQTKWDVMRTIAQ
jgi:hypothetical protein